MRFVAHTQSHTGLREQNEDSVRAVPELGLFVVADGVGGNEGGEVASREAVDALIEAVRNSPPTRNVERTIEHACEQAHRAVHTQRIGRLRGMASTIAAILVRDGRIAIAHVGDSRVYRLRQHQFVALTRDHSVGAELGQMCAEGESARVHNLYGHMLTRAIGVQGEHEAELRAEKARVGDVYLLCTDGLTNSVPDRFLADVLEKLPVTAACNALVEIALAGGARDNVTACVVRIEPEAD